MNKWWILGLMVLCITGCSYASECSEQLDIVFLIDSSASIRDDMSGGDSWALVTEFVARTVGQINVGSDSSRVGVLHYSTLVHEPQVLYLDEGASHDAVLSRVRALQFLGGNTNTSGALWYATSRLFGEQRGDRGYARDVAILITDGLSNVDSEHTAGEAARAKASGVNIFTIGVTKESDTAELTEIASDPVGFYRLQVPSFDELNSVVDLLLGRICIARPPPRLPCANSQIDIAILMDESGSITDKNPSGTNDSLFNWHVMTRFVAGIVESLRIGPQLARVAVVTFSDIARPQIYLNDNHDADSMVMAVQALHYNSGATNISGALRVMREQVFTASRGDRDGVQNVGVLITDGESTLEEARVQNEATLLKLLGVRMFSLGITNSVDLAELQTVASEPYDSHVFQTEKISDVSELAGVLVWGVCSEAPCEQQGSCPDPRAARCEDVDSFRWAGTQDRLLLGYNHARLQAVDSVEQCKAFCLQDPDCRSIDYILAARECSVSYVTRHDQPMEFAQSTGAHYYEWICTQNDYQPRYNPIDGSAVESGVDDQQNTGKRSRASVIERPTILITCTQLVFIIIGIALGL